MTAPPPEVGQHRRVYAATRGRLRTLDKDLGLDTQVMARPSPDGDPPPLPQEQAQVLAACPTPRGMPELAAELALPLEVVTALVAELRDHGLVDARAPHDMTNSENPKVSMALMQELLVGLRKSRDKDLEREAREHGGRTDAS